MEQPDVSAALLRIAGDGFAEDLRKRLLQLAEQTDDEAYASRLRLVASGRRPLRTLLADPQWQRAFSDRVPVPEEPVALGEEQRRALDEAVERARRQIVPPSPDQAAADAADVKRRAHLTADAVRQDQLNGWTHVYDTDDGTESSPRSDR
ncbi:hypothetical protein [Microbacterium luticocti]|uniref:hypothetical protein n=1 Tax=Microbacterium luticocti TaxID=451764 RepID=UPI00048DC60A|nr:hypothetical protein [Microbacterium luticocti]